MRELQIVGAEKTNCQYRHLLMSKGGLAAERTFCVFMMFRIGSNLNLWCPKLFYTFAVAIVYVCAA